MVLDTAAGGVAFLLGRILFGGILAFMGLNHVLNLEDMSGYAGSKGLPAPRLSVAGSGFVLLLGGLSIVAGAYPLVGATLLVVFFVVVTPVMHDFWSVEDPERRQTELTQFLKNAALLGGALLIGAVGGAEWPYALGLGVGL